MTDRKNWSKRRADAMQHRIIEAGTRLHIDTLENRYAGLNLIEQARTYAKLFDDLGMQIRAEYRRSYAPPKKSKPALVNNLSGHRIYKERTG